MNSDTGATAEFKTGDNVVLAEGPYQGTAGVFMHLTEDFKWAEISECNRVGTNARARAHPVIWLKHVTG